MEKEEKVDRILERKERKDYKNKKEQEKDLKYNDLPSNLLHKLYR